ncbi:MAG: trimeric intracellular cation channel family protein [Anaerofustis stercorihominis]|nr:trimeric intracellular cation channel family protein [Anaerofustis stercorihominis]
MNSETFILFLELAGTVAFAVSGAMSAMKKEMDIFGVCTLGLITSVGGGVIRDLVLGITPPNTFRNPVYALTAVITSVIIFLPGVRKVLFRHRKVYDKALHLMDTVGLGIFTVVGVRTAMLMQEEYGIFLLVFVGLITGIGGGIIRDVLAGNTPFVFVEQIYACASVAGAVVCAAMWYFGEGYALICGAFTVITIRLIAVKYDMQLPKAKFDDRQ